MKTIASIAMSLAIGLGLSGCGGDGSTAAAPSPSQNIVQVAQTTAGLDDLVAAVTKANLGATLSGTTRLTVFAPTDAAFDALATQLGLGTGANLVNTLPASALASILTYHVLGSAQAAATLEAEPSVATLYSFGGNAASLTLSATGGGLTITDADLTAAHVTTANVQASNGIVHVIDKVLIPPGVLNVVQMAQANPIFSSLVGAVVSANLATTLSGTGPFTVFAPTNAAFAQIQSTVASLSTAQLALVLEYHVLPEAVQASAIPFGQPIVTVAGQDITIRAGTPPTIVDTTSTPANIIATDVEASNGVIHVIDKVLIPVL